MNLVHSFEIHEDGSTTENKVDTPNDTTQRLKTRFGDLAVDVANEVICTIQLEDNVLYYENKFWNEVKEILINE